ncbi:hypothetical protein [Undibacterium sp. Ji49W]|uniref:hypothetical protein n=1 Tax=Undibacterium sp. Ji49W TaxID=3413040 RepID=UPI003BF14FE6
MRFNKKIKWLLGCVIIVWGSYFIFEIVNSWRAVQTLCTDSTLGMTESELVKLTKQLALRYRRLNPQQAIVIADLTPDGPDCRIIFQEEKVKSVKYNGNGFSKSKP